MHDKAVIVLGDVQSWLRLHDKDINKALDFNVLTRTLDDVVKGYEPTFSS